MSTRRWLYITTAAQKRKHGPMQKLDEVFDHELEHKWVPCWRAVFGNSFPFDEKWHYRRPLAAKKKGKSK